MNLIKIMKKNINFIFGFIHFILPMNLAFFIIRHLALSFKTILCALCFPDLLIKETLLICLDSQRILSPIISSPTS